MKHKLRILTGDRTTGKLHLGHYVGSLQNRAALQNQYETFILLADVQALTTHFKNPMLIAQSILDVAIDNLSAGLDPEAVCFVQQSQVPAIAELTRALLHAGVRQCAAPQPHHQNRGEAVRIPGVDIRFSRLSVSQAADITFCKADLVPVGEDQLPHLELSRKLVRRFRDRYGADFLHVPEPLLSRTPRLAGLDGNAKNGQESGQRYLPVRRRGDRPAEGTNRAVTDFGRIAVSDKGNPDICQVSRYHKVFNPGAYQDICQRCKNAAIGCVACKGKLTETLNALLGPMRERRGYYENNLPLVKDIIAEGTRKAKGIGNDTVSEVKAAMGLRL